MYSIHIFAAVPKFSVWDLTLFVAKRGTQGLGREDEA